MSRLPDLRPDGLSDEQRRLYDAVAGGDRARDASFRLTEADGSLVGPFGALLLNPSLGDALQKVGAAIRFGGTLDPAVREVAILAVAAEHRSAFEWWAHEPVARRAGLTDAQITALRAGEAPAFDDGAATAAHAFSTALIAGGRPDDATFETAREALGLDGIMELVTLVGYYTLLAQLMDTFDIGVPSGETSPF